MAADGRVEIDARIDDSNLEKDIDRVNRSLERVGENMGEASRQAVKQTNDAMQEMSGTAKDAYKDVARNAESSSQSVASSADNIEKSNEQIADSAIEAARAQQQQANAAQEAAQQTERAAQRSNSAYKSQEQYQRQAYNNMSETTRQMYDEMRKAQYGHSAAMTSLREDAVKAQYSYFQLAESSKTFTGTTQEFMTSVQTAGKEYKRVQDEMIKANEHMRMSMLMQVGTMLNMTTQASRISSEYDRMKNPMYAVNKAGLAVADSMNQIANKGSAAVLALRQLGPKANMKALNDMQMMITQGQMRFQMVAMASLVTVGLVYSGLHKAAIKSVAGYEEAFNRMKATVGQALEPMIQVFGAVMKKVFEFVTAIAEMIVKFNEAHPILAKILQGIVMLVPALMLILSPLAVGIGLVGGFLAAWNSIWMLIAPLITGLAAMSATVWLVAAAIVGLVAIMIILWNKSETFRSIVIGAWEGIKAAVQAVIDFIRPYVEMALDAVNTYVKSKLDELKAFWDENGAQIMAALEKVWNFITAIIKFAMAVISPFLFIAWQAIKIIIISTWEAIKNVIDGALKVIQGIIKVFTGIFTGDWKMLWDGIKMVLVGALQLIWGLINLSFIGKFLKPIKAFGGKAWTFIKGAWDKILGFLKKINLFKIGADIIKGLLKGINSMVGKVIDKAKSLASGIGGAIKTALGIHSPSRVTMELAEFAGEGIIVGLDGQISNVMDAASRVANAVSKPIEQKITSKPMLPTGGVVNKQESVQNDNSTSFNIERVEVKDTKDVKLLAREFNNLVESRRRAVGYA